MIPSQKQPMQSSQQLQPPQFSQQQLQQQQQTQPKSSVAQQQQQSIPKSLTQQQQQQPQLKPQSQQEELNYQFAYRIEKFHICVDPDSEQIYGLNPHSNEVYIFYQEEQDIGSNLMDGSSSNLQLISQQQPQSSQGPQSQQLNNSVNPLGRNDRSRGSIRAYRKKAQEAIKNIEEITRLNNGQWMINHERADQYRRRKMPNYLLQRTDWNHPTYICQSPLSQVFVEKKEIIIEVNLDNFKNQILKLNQKEPFSINVGLVTAADEVMKNILRKIYKEYQVKLVPDKDYSFILKMEGYREYLNGHYPMLAYDRVRMNLRAGKPLKVVLNQRENQVENQKFFPPDFERLFITITHVSLQNRIEKHAKEMPFDQNQVLRYIEKEIMSSSDEKIKALFKGNNYKIIDNANLIIHKDMFNIDWNIYCDIPILLWYAPQKLPKYVPNQNIQELTRQQKVLAEQLRLVEDEFNKFKTVHERVYQQTRGFLFYNPQYAIQTKEEEDYPETGYQEMQLSSQGQHSEENSQQLTSIEKIVETGKNLLQNNYLAFYNLKKVSCKIDPNKFLRGCEQAEKFAKRFLGEGQSTDLKLRVISKERMNEFVNKRRTLFSQKIFSEQPTNLYSGECDWNFKIKIRGIENVYRLFEQADMRLQQDKRATYNGILPPNYITKAGEWKRALEHGEKIEIPQRCDGTPDPVLRLSKVIPPHYQNKNSMNSQAVHGQAAQQQMAALRSNSTNQEPEGFMPDDVPQDFKFIFSTDHGDRHCHYFSQIQQYYDLDFPPYLIQVQVKLMYGNRALSYKVQTKKIPFSRSPRWNEWVKFPSIKISQLPLESRICFDVIIYSATGIESQTIASTTQQIFDQNCRFAQGLSPLNLWPFYASEDRLGCMGQYYGLIDKSKKPVEQRDFQKWEQFKAEEYARLFIELDTFQKHMFWSLRDDKTMINLEFQLAKNRLEDLWVYTPQNQYLAELKELLKRDPIHRNFDMREKLILLICRNHYKSIPQALDIFLCAVDWTNPEHIRETYNLLKDWKSPPFEECITFLDAHHADEVIRLYGVERISKMADDEIKLYMIELIQALMFENNHYSAIQELLLERALLNPFVVGHELFWSLKSQLHLKPSYERFALFLEQLLMVSGEYRTELLNEVKVNDDLKRIARSIKKCSNDVERKGELQKLLGALSSKYKQQNIDFTLAIDNRLQLNGFVLEKCKFMNSKKKPLWLVMKNKENQSKFSIMFKDGDDLRQDILTLQLIRIMDKIWLDNSLDLRMKPYNVVATLDQVGMLEIVGNSETTASIHKKYNKRFGCLMNKSIMQFIEDNNTDEKKKAKAIENFKLSCAGYCVATCIIGIGDRHSDNIMLTKEGHFFHIDFGHFLGNFKRKFGFNRERSPFVFTKVMDYVLLQNENDKIEFEENCCQAYNLIRKHGNFFVNIFRMMLSAGMPELQRESDIEYLVEMLQLNLSDEEASVHFKKQIAQARNDMVKLFDNFIHEWVKK